MMKVPPMSSSIAMCRVIHPGRAKGRALVSNEAFPLSGVSFKLDEGCFAWPGHPLHGQSVEGRVLVLPKVTAFAGGDWALLALSTHYRKGPSAILCADLPPMLVAGAVLGKIVTVAQLPLVLLHSIQDGDLVEIYTEPGIVRIARGDEPARSEVLEYRLQPSQHPVLKLTEEEARVLDGQKGAALQECLAAMCSYGQALSATSLMSISSVHAAGSGYNTTGESAVAFLQRLANYGIRTAVPSTLNPIAIDLERWDKVLGLPEELLLRQVQLNRAFQDLGFTATYSCKPYWTNWAPPPDANFVSSEHNVVSYANSVIGARTNFESNIMAILAAILGLIPKYGLYMDQNRLPTFRVRVQAPLEDPVDWRCLGVAAARQAEGRIPFFELPNVVPDRHRLRDLCASFGPPWTSVPMLHVDGVTPGFQTARIAAGRYEEIVISGCDLRSIRDEFFVPTSEAIDLVALGCPQASIEEIAEIVKKMEGRRVHSTSRLWIWTDASTREEAKRRGYVSTLLAARAQVVADTCGCAACPINRSSLQITRVATDSTKSFGFLRRTGLSCHLGSLDECVGAATTGRWNRLRD